MNRETIDAGTNPREIAAERGHLPVLEPEEGPSPAEVLHELNLILNSSAFRPSKRSQEFLAFVVNYRLGSSSEALKERAIGSSIFHRPADYDTGADSVVRVQAGEVRRRLHLYEQSRPAASRLHIDLPVGSYTPIFTPLQHAAQAPATIHHSEIQTHEAPVEAAAEELAPSTAKKPARRRAWRLLGWMTAAVVLLAGGIVLWTFWAPRTALDRFWAPIVGSGRPVVIYLPKLLCYHVTDELYERTAKSPGEFAAVYDRLNLPPHLGPNDTIHWNEIAVDDDRGPGIGDIKASVHLAKYLQSRHAESDLRIGKEFTFEDLKNSPTILIGAFSNRWTLQMTKGLHYSFDDSGEYTSIRENTPNGQKWLIEWDNKGATYADFGLVTRLVNPKTGQLSVVVAGIGSNGSEAAAEIVTNPQTFAKAIASVPGDWSKKNIQIVVKVPVTDSINGPPVVMGTYVW